MTDSRLNETTVEDKGSELFTVPAYPTLMQDISDGKLHVELTPESKQFWEQGRAGQGYIGLMELPKPTDPDPTLVRIHLLPAFNKDDGLMRTDKDGKPFQIRDTDGKLKSYSSHLVSAQQRGTFTGDLHMNAVRSLGLGEKGNTNGLVMGFGMWKEGAAIRVIDDSMENRIAVPNEYVLTLSQGGASTLEFIDESFQVSNININEVPGLSEAIDKYHQIINDKLSNANIENKSKLEKEKAMSKIKEEGRLQSGMDAVINQYNKIEPGNGIKFAKNRSTSQNMNAVKYTPEYEAFFNILTKGHGSHQIQLKREIPLPVFDFIMENTCSQLNINKLDNLAENKAVQGFGGDNVSEHFVFYNWYKSRGSVNACRDIIREKIEEIYEQFVDIIFNQGKNVDMNRMHQSLDEKIQQLENFCQSYMKINGNDLSKMNALPDNVITLMALSNKTIANEVNYLDVNAPYFYNKDMSIQPIHFAIMCKDTEAIKLLVKNGASIDAIFTHPDLANENMTPLSFALEQNNIKLLETILECKPKFYFDDMNLCKSIEAENLLAKHIMTELNASPAEVEIGAKILMFCKQLKEIVDLIGVPEMSAEYSKWTNINPKESIIYRSNDNFTINNHYERLYDILDNYLYTNLLRDIKWASSFLPEEEMLQVDELYNKLGEGVLFDIEQEVSNLQDQSELDMSHQEDLDHEHELSSVKETNSLDDQPEEEESVYRKSSL